METMMTFPTPKQHPVAWTIGVIVLLAALIALFACGPIDTPETASQAELQAAPESSCTCPALAAIAIPAISTDWTSHGTAWRDHDGLVHLEGSMAWRSTFPPQSWREAPMFLLPAGYRPLVDRELVAYVYDDNAQTRLPVTIVIRPDGTGTVMTTTAVATRDIVGLDGISFLAAP
jgi:hypothetical protein